MTKQEYIDYWISNSERDWSRANLCFKGRDYVFCIFCIHLSFEKICKALWVKNNIGNHPPRIHNLEKLLLESKVELTDKNWELLLYINRFNLEGRYPDYKSMIYKECTRAHTQSILKQSEKLKKCLLEKMQ